MRAGRADSARGLASGHNIQAPSTPGVFCHPRHTHCLSHTSIPGSCATEPPNAQRSGASGCSPIIERIETTTTNIPFQFLDAPQLYLRHLRHSPLGRRSRPSSGTPNFELERLREEGVRRWLGWRGRLRSWWLCPSNSPEVARVRCLRMLLLLGSDRSCRLAVHPAPL